MRNAALILLSALLLAGCNGPATNTNAPSNANSNTDKTPVASTSPIKSETPLDPNFKICNPYLPLVPGSEAVYAITYSSNLTADARVVVDLKEENGQKVFIERTQIIDRSGGYEKNEVEVKKYTCDGERVRLIHYNTENWVQNVLNRSQWKFRADAVAMPKPAELKGKGFRWSYSFTISIQRGDEPPVNIDEPTFIFFESAGEEEVTVPAGTFKALKVIRKVGKNEVTDYYVPGLGLIRRQAAEGTAWALKEYAGIRPTE
jgi:hypothetical protein